MKDFSKQIGAEWNFVAEFFFHRLHSISGRQRYHVSVKDRSGHSFFFNMQERTNGSWMIVNAPKVPDWIMQLENKLQGAILESIEV